MKKLSIIIPVYNEEELVEELFRRLETLKGSLKEKLSIKSDELEIIFVNDGSGDRTFERLYSLILRHEGYRAINLSRNYGHQLATTAGLDCASGEAVVIMDGDLQDPPEFIVDLYRKYLEGYDVVYARRKKRKGETWFKLLTAKLFYLLLKKLSSTDIPEDTGDFRLFSKRVASALRSMKENHRFIRGMVSWVGFKQTGLEYERDERYAGVTKFSVMKMMKFAMDGITSFSTFPLKLSIYFGFISISLGFFFTLYVLYVKLFLSLTVEGWLYLMVAMFFLGGIQLFTTGALGEYTGRINDEVKHRPLYLIEGIYEGPGENRGHM